MDASRRKLIDRLQNKLGVTFAQPMLLLEAVTHPACEMEGPAGGKWNYQRLEFIGDAVLGMVVGVGIFKRFPRMDEGEMSQLRSEIVSNEALGVVGEGLGLLACMLMPPGMNATYVSNANMRRRLCACVLEAIIGALYLDQDLAACERFVQDVVIGDRYDALARKHLASAAPVPDDPVSAAFADLARFPVPAIPEVLDDALCTRTLKDVFKGRGLPPPSYHNLPCPKDAPKGTCCIECRVFGVLVATGIGVNGGQAKRAAATIALKTIGSWWPKQ
jgi:dsRNA-specific ribonuclease